MHVTGALGSNAFGYPRPQKNQKGPHHPKLGASRKPAPGIEGMSSVDVIVKESQLFANPLQFSRSFMQNPLPHVGTPL